MITGCSATIQVQNPICSVKIERGDIFSPNDELIVMLTEKTRKLLVCGIAIATVAFAPGMAFAISDNAECQNEVQQVMRDLLKADVNATDLVKIDAAILAAEANCQSGDFSGAESKLNEARSMMTSTGQN